MATRKTLCFTGMDAADESKLKEVFARANAGLGNRWALASEADADALVVDVDSIYGHMTWLKVHNSDRTIVALSASPKTEADHVLTRPVDEGRLAALLAELEGRPAAASESAAPARAEPRQQSAPEAAARAEPVAARPQQPPARAEPAAAVAAPPRPAVDAAAAPVTEVAAGNDVAAPSGRSQAAAPLAQAQTHAPAQPAAAPPRDPMLADYLGRSALPGPVRLEMSGAPTLALDPQHQQYIAAQALKPLIPWCQRVIRIEDWDATTPAELEKLKAAQGTHPYARLLWLFALVQGEGKLAPGFDAAQKFRLVKWPQIEREYPKHFRIATVMMKQPATPAEIAEQSGAPLPEVNDFINAYLATGFAEVEEPPAPVEANAQARSGFLDRLRGRTG